MAISSPAGADFCLHEVKIMLQATSTATKDEAVNVFFCNLGMVEVLIIGTNISLKLCEWNLSLSLKTLECRKARSATTQWLDGLRRRRMVRLCTIDWL
jgi:hypothetical protein